MDRVLWVLIVICGLLVTPAGAQIVPCPPGQTCLPPSPGQPPLFTIGTMIQVETASVFVYQTPGGPTAIGTEPRLARALVVGGPTTLADQSVWYLCSFTTGLSGWTQGTGLVALVMPVPVVNITIPPTPGVIVDVNGVPVP